MAKKTSTRFGLYVTTERDNSYGQYFHVRATPVTIGTTLSERIDIDHGQSPNVSHTRIRNCSSSRAEDNDLYLSNLQINSQGNGQDNPRTLYGWELEYRNVFSVDLHTAERMAKTLKTIDARMRKADEKYGRPATFGAYVARVADAIGADAIVYCENNYGRRGWSYEDVENRILDIYNGVSHIDHLVRQWQRETETANAKTECA